MTHRVFAFQDEHPNIEVLLSLSDRRVDLVEEGVDIAVRLGPLGDSTLVGRRVGSCRRLIVAAPDYLARHGQPKRLVELAHHNYMRFQNATLNSSLLSAVGPTGREETVEVQGNFLADHALALREAVVAGRGLGAVHEWLVADLLATGQLQHILTDYELTPVALNLLSLPGRLNITRVRLFADAAVEALRTLPGIDSQKPL